MVEPEDQDENDEQKGDPERTIAGIESAKKTKQEAPRIHLPSPFPPCMQFAERGKCPAAWSVCVCSFKPERM